MFVHVFLYIFADTYKILHIYIYNMLPSKGCSFWTNSATMAMRDEV